MNRFSRWTSLGLSAVIVGTVLALIGCGTTSSSSSSKSTQMRVVHLAPSPGPVDLLLDNKSVFTNITYGVPTAFASVTAGNRDLKFDLAGGGANLIESPTESFVAGTSYTDLFFESTGGGGTTYASAKLIDDHTTPDKGKFKIRVVNGSPNAGAVDVYLVIPGTATCSTLGTPVPALVPTIAGLGSNAPSAYQSLISSTYNLCVTTAGKNTSADVLIRQDGTNGTTAPTFSDGQVRTLIMKNQIPVGTSLYDTVTLTDLN